MPENEKGVFWRMVEMSKEEGLQFTRCCNIMLDLIKKYGATAKEKENTNEPPKVS